MRRACLHTTHRSSREAYPPDIPACVCKFSTSRVAGSTHSCGRAVSWLRPRRSSRSPDGSPQRFGIGPPSPVLYLCTEESVAHVEHNSEGALQHQHAAGQLLLARRMGWVNGRNTTSRQPPHRSSLRRPSGRTQLEEMVPPSGLLLNSNNFNCSTRKRKHNVDRV